MTAGLMLLALFVVLETVLLTMALKRNAALKEELNWMRQNNAVAVQSPYQYTSTVRASTSWQPGSGVTL